MRIPVNFFTTCIVYSTNMKLVSFKNCIDQIIFSHSQTHLKKDFMSI